MSREDCDRATRFINTPEGWDAWCNHVDNCTECKADMDYFYGEDERRAA